MDESVAGIQTNRSSSRFQTTGQGRPAENPLIAQQSRRKLAGYKRLQIVQAFANAYPVDRHGPHALTTRSNRRQRSALGRTVQLGHDQTRQRYGRVESA